MTPNRISAVIIEDDRKLAALIREYLDSHGFDTSLAHDGPGGVEAIASQRPDVVVLDLMLPGFDGLTVCRHVRAHYDGLILMLTAIDDDLDQVAAIEVGVDDYVVKPIELRLLLARLRMLLRRMKNQGQQASNDTRPAELAFGELTISRKRRDAFLAERALRLNQSEFDLFWLLALHAETVMSREILVRKLRGITYDGLDRSIDTRVVGLRKKVGDCSTRPFRILTVRGKGYLFVSDAWGRQ